MPASIVDLSDGDELERAGRELLAALALRPRELPSRYGYDERGSALFERITELSDYYPPRLERALLARLAPDLAPYEDLVELGSGSGRKTQILLDALLETGPVLYTQLDISGDALRESCHRYARYHPDLRVSGAIGEFLPCVRWAAGHRAGRTLVTMLGSTIGNMSRAARGELWRTLSHALLPGDGFLVGADLVKGPAIIEAAYRCGYERPGGVRTRFALNRLSHVNATFGGDFDQAAFEPDSIYDSRRRRVEGRLTSTRRQVVTLSRLHARLEIDDGEVILRDVMQKFTIDELTAEAAAHGCRMTRSWTDAAGWYVVALFEPHDGGA